MATQTLLSTGAAVRSAMTAKRISQRRVADELALSQAAIFRRLNGDVDFTVSELTAVAELLDTPIAEFLIQSAPSSVVSPPAIPTDGGASSVDRRTA